MNKTTKNKRKLPMKLFLFIGLLVFSFLIVSGVTYILEYNKNVPVLFDEEIKATEFNKLNKSEIFDIELKSIAYSPKRTNSTNNGQMEIDYTIFLNEEKINQNNISNVKVTFSTGCYWGKCNDESSSKTVSKTYYIKDENKDIKKQTLTSQITLKTEMPLKGNLPFISVKTPDLYIKLSYTVTSVADQTTEEKTEYFKVKANTWKNIFDENY